MESSEPSTSSSSSSAQKATTADPDPDENTTSPATTPDPDSDDDTSFPSGESTNVALVVLMGLPASGKSSLAKQLISNFSKWHVFVISYDEFVPLSTQFEMREESTPVNLDGSTKGPPSSSKGGPTDLKSVRNKFVNCVESIVRFAKNYDTNRLSCAELNQSLSVVGRGKRDEMLAQSAKIIDRMLKLLGDSSSKVVIVVDDNNYYHSMRSSYFQIARRLRTGFCLISCKADLKTCVHRNFNRAIECQVAHRTIIEMSLRYQQPNPMSSACDALCVEVDTREPINFGLLKQLVSSSFKNFPRRIDDDYEEVVRQRRICSENEIHQADIVLRKWIGKKINVTALVKEPGTGSTLAERKKTAKDLNLRKSKTLDKLRSGEFRISFKVEEDVGFRKQIIAFFEKVDAN